MLQTSWPTLRVTDYLDCSDGRARSRSLVAADLDPARIDGTGRARVVFAPRLDFGRLPTQIEIRDGGLEVVNAAGSAGPESRGRGLVD